MKDILKIKSQVKHYQEGQKIIYVTPFRELDKVATAESISSGFKTLEQVIQALGNEYRKKTKRFVIYGSGDDSVVFSDFRFK